MVTDFLSMFYSKVYYWTKKIPKGKVATYGLIAILCKSPNASRVVGNALHHNPNPPEIPCHRVVNRDGCLAKKFGDGGKDVQKERLENEGVFVDENFKVELSKYLWNPFL